jgi:hypothetical protein
MISKLIDFILNTIVKVFGFAFIFAWVLMVTMIVLVIGYHSFNFLKSLVT